MKDGSVYEGIMKNGVKEGEWKSSRGDETIQKEKFARGFTVTNFKANKETEEAEVVSTACTCSIF